uniref:Cartilage intermediate layer protein 1 n=1 Tax=Geotrypetes seraphini TaxID=260995 RepID=A0A6P8PLC4_GEOSA|nr:cartilage intermediate layer protein 1 [Geotrypetes seraphini]
MMPARCWLFPLLLLEITRAFIQGSRSQTAVLNHSVRRMRTGNKVTASLEKNRPEDSAEWTTWFNIDHPGGNGDYERLDAIRFYYRDRVCQRPTRMEARTTDWIPADSTGEVVHFSLEKGFWCINKQQPSGKNCSNYSVRFLCPKGDAEEVWSSWSTWSECPVKCGERGVQTRSRSCLAESQRQAHCSGRAQEGRRCLGNACTACELSCPMGRADAACEACVCEGHVLHGVIRLMDGAPAARASIYQQVKKPKLLTTSDDAGRFTVPGLCPDGNTRLQITKEKYSTLTVTVPKNSTKVSSISVSFQRAAKPSIVENPENKARYAGQSVTFCCNAVGEPAPTKYLWYHNGTLLDPKMHKYNSKLGLAQLQMNQAGEYYCQASNEVGSIKSTAARLTVIAPGRASCEPRPESHLIRLPQDCFQNETNSFYYEVGNCPRKMCAGKPDKALKCKETVAYCCGVSKTEVKEISCNGYTLPTKVATECGCQRCVETKSIVRGRAIAADNGEPMRFGHIYMEGKRVSITGYKGTFTIQIPAHVERLVLTFVDRLQKFVNTTKVLPFSKKGGAVFHEIKLLRKAAPIIIDSTETNEISLGDSAGNNPIAELEIPPHSFYRQNGELYIGKVKASVTFLDARNISTATAAQSDLNFVNEEGDVFPLRTYGMFSVDFSDERATETLNAGEVKVYLDSEQVKMPEHLENMKLWSLNPETGLWEEEGDFKPDKGRRGKREERIFLVGNMEIRERRLFNLDVAESRRCYVKVRAYRSEHFQPSEQIKGAVVNLINMEPEAGFASNPRAWGRFDSVITGTNGACLPAFCDGQKPDAYSAYVTASLGGEELEAVESAPKFNPNRIGVPQPYLNKLDYKRTDHDDPKIKKTAFRINLAKPTPNAAEETNGPIYAFENLRECEEAPYSAAHFRFYRVEGDRYDYNTVPFNEDDPMSWTDDYLAWWPKPMEFRACYIKVKINGPQEVNVRARNMGGTHPKTAGQLYGIRDVRSIRDMDQPSLSTACLEFKCSGMLYDQDRVDRTLVKIIPQGSCRRENVNSMLHEYLVNHLPLAVNNDTSEYTMLAPLDPLGHNYGIYTVTDQDPRTAKEIALGRCFDGTSDGSSRVMKNDVGVALTFTCVEKEPRQTSIFQLGQRSSGTPLREGTESGRQLRSSIRDRSARRVSSSRSFRRAPPPLEQ